MGLTDYTVSDKKYFESGRNYERKRLLEDLMKLTDRFNSGESDANMVMYLYRFIEEKSKSEGDSNLRFVDTEILDLQISTEEGEQK